MKSIKPKLPIGLKIFPLGDSAVTIELGNLIDENLHHKVVNMQQLLLENPFEGLKDLVTGYCSLSLIYDPLLVRKKYPGYPTAYDFVKHVLEEIHTRSTDYSGKPSEVIQIPVCYDAEFGFDLDIVANSKGLNREDIIALHSGVEYKVFMIGFLPGFSYMGELDGRLEMPRKKSPVAVTAGSVGITGKQTGIYPLSSPGGWHIIGRTPVKIFDPYLDLPVRLKTGDRVRFIQIDREAYDQYR